MSALKSFAEFRFVASANSPETWQIVAYELIGSANLCFRRFKRKERRGLTRSYTLAPDASLRVPVMLYAFGLEALLKGLWLAQGKGRRSTTAGKGNTRQLEKKFGHHRLADWWQDTSMPTATGLDADILKLLENFAEIGRYPVRRTPRDSRQFFRTSIDVDIVRLLTAVDREIRTLRPMFSKKLGKTRLHTVGTGAFRGQQ